LNLSVVTTNAIFPRRDVCVRSCATTPAMRMLVGDGRNAPKGC